MPRWTVTFYRSADDFVEVEHVEGEDADDALEAALRERPEMTDLAELDASMMLEQV